MTIKDLDLTDRMALDGEAFAPDSGSLAGRDITRLVLIDALAEPSADDGLASTANTADAAISSSSADVDAITAPQPLIHRDDLHHAALAITVTPPPTGGDPGNGSGTTPPPSGGGDPIGGGGVTPPPVTQPSPPTALAWSAGGTVGQDAQIGTVIGTVHSTDPQGGQISYGLLGGSGVAVDQHSGQVTVTDPADINATGPIIVTATNSAGLTTTTTLTETVTPLHLTSLSLSSTVLWSAGGSNGATAGQVVGSIAVTDDDPRAASHAVTYSLSGTDASDFKVVGGQLEASQELGSGVYHVTLTATSAVSGSTISENVNILVTPADHVTATAGSVGTAYQTAVTLTEAQILSLVHAQSSFGELLHVASIGDAGGNATVTETAGAYGNSWTITPAAGYSGAEQITVTVGDRETTATTTIELDVAGLPPPVVTPPPPTEHLSGGTFSIGSFSQTSGAFTITTAQILDQATSSLGETLTVANLTADHGTLTAIAGGWTYTPDASYTGLVNLTATVNDTDGNSALVLAHGVETAAGGSITISNLPAGLNLLDTETSNLMGNVNLSGGSGGSVTATITVSDTTAGATSSIGATLAGTGLVAQGGGVYTITGTLAQVQADLRTLTVTPDLSNGEAAGAIDSIGVALSITDGTSTGTGNVTVQATPGDVSAPSFTLPFAVNGGWIDDAVSGTVNLAAGSDTLQFAGVANHAGMEILDGIDHIIAANAAGNILDLAGNGAAGVVGGTSGHLLIDLGTGGGNKLIDDVLAAGTTSPIWITNVSTVTDSDTLGGARAVTVDASNTVTIGFNFATDSGIVTIASGLNALTVNKLVGVTEIMGDPDTSENLGTTSPHATLTISTQGNFGSTEFADWTTINLSGSGATDTLGQVEDVGTIHMGVTGTNTLNVLIDPASQPVIQNVATLNETWSADAAGATWTAYGTASNTLTLDHGANTIGAIAEPHAGSATDTINVGAQAGDSVTFSADYTATYLVLTSAAGSAGEVDLADGHNNLDSISNVGSVHLGAGAGDELFLSNAGTILSNTEIVFGNGGSQLLSGNGEIIGTTITDAGTTAGSNDVEVSTAGISNSTVDLLLTGDTMRIGDSGVGDANNLTVNANAFGGGLVVQGNATGLHLTDQGAGGFAVTVDGSTDATSTLNMGGQGDQLDLAAFGGTITDTAGGQNITIGGAFAASGVISVAGGGTTTLEGDASGTINLSGSTANTVNVFNVAEVADAGNAGVTVNGFGAGGRADVINVDAVDVQFAPDGSGGSLVQTDDGSPGTWHTIADLAHSAAVNVATQADAAALMAQLQASGQFTHH